MYPESAYDDYNDYYDSLCGVKTELMDMNTLTWSAGPDYPFTSE